MPHSIPIYSFITMITGLLCLSQGLFVFIKNKSSRPNQLYFAFCASTSFWLFSMTLISSKLFSESTSIILGKLIYTGVVFIPTFALHFCIAFLRKNILQGTSFHLKLAYLLTFIFLGLVWLTDQFIVGTYHYSWGWYPEGGPLHCIHMFFVWITVGYAIYLLGNSMRLENQESGKTQFYYETKYLFVAFTFMILASYDFLPNLGVDVFPVGFIFVTVFIFSTTIALFKHNLMGVSIAFKKSLAYSALASVIAVLYFVAIYVVGTFVKDRAQIRSLPVTIALLTAITLLARPLERKITRAIDKLFFKKTMDVMETENKRLLDEVQKQDRLKAVATLAAGMAHEVKNPLTVMKTYTEYLPKKIGEAGFLESYQNTMSREIDRIDGIVKKLLDFSKPEKPHIEPIDAIKLIQEALSFLSADFIKNNIDIETNLPDPGVLILADRKQFHQVLLNLCLNAIDAMPRGGTLSITAEPDEDRAHLRLTVRDTGDGIAPDKLRRVFEPFFTTKDSGTGLGLSIVHGIVTEHRGKIVVDSQLGRGTCFMIWWPLSLESDKKLNPHPPRSRRGSSRRCAE